MKKYSMNNSNLLGGFFIILSNVKSEPVCYFVFYDHQRNIIGKYQVHHGKSYYKQFNNFILEALFSYNKDNVENFLVYVPKNFVNKNVIKNIKILTGISIEKYTMNSNSPEIISEIKSLLSITSFKIGLEKHIDLINNWLKEKNSIQLSACSIGSKKSNTRNIQKRDYSTKTSNWVVNPSIRYRGWFSFSINGGQIPLTDNMINYLVNKFWDVIVLPKVKIEKFKLGLQFRVQFIDDSTKSITYIDRGISENDMEEVKDHFISAWNAKSEMYHTFPVIRLIIFHKILPKNIEKRISRPVEYKSTPSYKFLGYNIPLTMDLAKWGNVKYNDKKTIATIKRYDSNLIYEAHIFRDVHIVNAYNEKHKVLFSFRDTLLDKNNLNSFKREFKNRTIIYMNGVQYWLSDKKECKFILPIKKHNKNTQKFLTMDIETRKIDNNMEPVCISFFDGKFIKSFYLTEYSNSNEMLSDALKAIMTPKYHGFKVYIHNFSYFDSVFLLKNLVPLCSKMNPIIRDNRFIKLDAYYENKTSTKGEKLTKNYVTFIDSFNLLPASLEDLGKNFNVENKSIFPYQFINNKNVSLNFVGDVPALNYFIKAVHFKNIKKHRELEDEYIKYKNQFNTWDLRKELIKYCEQDVRTLHQVLVKFSNEIFERFKINISRYPSLPSLAFAIYRSNFLSNKSKIPIITGLIYNDIKNAYLGGLVDVYKPFARNVEAYDVNSLYPSSMFNYPMPVGNPTYFEGNPVKYVKDPFGYFYVSVDAPVSFKIPILQAKIKSKKGEQKTICPVGTWEGWYFSEEIKNAMKYGYKFKIHKGYLFSKENLFTSYVDNIYKIKVSSEKGSPWYIISKLLLNSLYGRFGMSPFLEEHKILTDNEVMSLMEKDIDIHELIEFDNDLSLVSYSKDLSFDEPDSINVSLPVAAAVTSWSRIQMTLYLTKYEEDLCYIDTDGIKVICKLDKNYIGPELGKMKHEGSFSEAVFLAPKVYGEIDSGFLAGTIEGSEAVTVKIKGVKIPISYWSLKSLLQKSKEGIKINQEKWYRDFEAGTIRVKDEIYTLMVTDNKRQIIWDSCGRFVDTAPYLLENGEIVSKDAKVLYYLPSIDKPFNI